MRVDVFGMGDHSSADIAQETHESNFRAKGCLLETEKSVWKQTAPHGPAWEGAYLDDHVWSADLPLRDLPHLVGA